MVKYFIFMFFSLALLAQTPKEPVKKVDPAKKEDVKEDDKSPKILTAEEAEKIEKEAELKRKEYIHIANFMKKEFVEKAEKDLPKLQAEITKKERQLQLATGDKARENLKKELTELKAKAESQKIWAQYHKVYLMKEDSYEKNDFTKYREAKNYLTKLEAKYLELTATKFPNFKAIFYEKYGEQAKQHREKQLNSK